MDSRTRTIPLPSAQLLVTPRYHSAMRFAVMLALLAAAPISAQSDGRFAVSGVAVLHGFPGPTGGIGGVPAASVSASYRVGDGDRLGAFALLSPESETVPRFAALGSTWDVLIARNPSSPYVTAGVAVVRQTELERRFSCSSDDICFDEGAASRKGFVSAAAVLGGGTRFDLGRGGFIRTDVQLLAGPELIRPLLSVGGGVRL